MRFLLPLLAASIPVAAMDIFDFSDLRVGVDTVGVDYDISFNGSDSNEKWNSASRFNADWVAGTDLILLGIGYGVGGTYDKRDSEVLDQVSTLGHVQAGPYLSLGPVQFELYGLAGVGTSTIATSAIDETASVEEFGLHLGVTVSLLHLVAGVRGGWLQQSADFSVNNGQDLTITSSDYTAGAFVGWRF